MWPELLDSARMVFYGALVKLSKLNSNSGLESSPCPQRLEGFI